MTAKDHAHAARVPGAFDGNKGGTTVQTACPAGVLSSAAFAQVGLTYPLHTPFDEAGLGSGVAV